MPRVLQILLVNSADGSLTWSVNDETTFSKDVEGYCMLATEANQLAHIGGSDGSTIYASSYASTFCTESDTNKPTCNNPVVKGYVTSGSLGSNGDGTFTKGRAFMACTTYGTFNYAIGGVNDLGILEDSDFTQCCT